VKKRYGPEKLTSKSISNVTNLCEALDVSMIELQEALELPPSERYVSKPVEKNDGSLRYVFKPHYLVRRIQRRINNRIFKGSPKSIIAWPDHLFGSIPNFTDDSGEEIVKDYVHCAARHCGAKSLLKVDIQNFFDNVHSDQVSHIFKNFFHYPEDVCSVLTDLCTHEGHLVQGGLNSSYLASLVLFDVEGLVAWRLEQKGLTYTRMVDDITVSSKVHSHSYEYAFKIIEQMLVDKDLPVNTKKTIIQRMSTSSLEVHGLRITFDKPRLPAKEVGRIRAAVRRIELLAQEPNYRTSHAYRKDYNRCMGRVNKLSRVVHPQHKKLVRRLVKIRPLPSKKDLDRVDVMISRLEKDSATVKRTTYWYWKRFYRAQERINILKRTFRYQACEFRLRLKAIKPTYE
jgi:RNA-directed DNA polymerase